jgi:hypothetical protein
MLLLFPCCYYRHCSFHSATLTLFLSCCSFCATLFVLHLCTTPLMLQLCVAFFMYNSSFNVASLAKLFSCYNCALLLSNYNSFFYVAPFVLPLLSHCSFHPTIFLMLSLPSHYSFHIMAHFKHMLAQPLLFFLCYHCCSSILHSYSIFFG